MKGQIFSATICCFCAITMLLLPSIIQAQVDLDQCYISITPRTLWYTPYFVVTNGCLDTYTPYGSMHCPTDETSMTEPALNQLALLLLWGTPPSCSWSEEWSYGFCTSFSGSNFEPMYLSGEPVYYFVRMSETGGVRLGSYGTHTEEFIYFDPELGPIVNEQDWINGEWSVTCGYPCNTVDDCDLGYDCIDYQCVENPAAECEENSQCGEGAGCVEGVCVANEPPTFISEPRWPYGYWPILSNDPANPHEPTSENNLFFAYDDDGVGCQSAPTLNWMYRPVELQAGEAVPLDDGSWTIEVPSWSFMYWVLIEEPTIADTTGHGLFEFKMTATDCLGQTTDSEEFYGKRYYFQVD